MATTVMGSSKFGRIDVENCWAGRAHRNDCGYGRLRYLLMPMRISKTESLLFRMLFIEFCQSAFEMKLVDPKRVLIHADLVRGLL